MSTADERNVSNSLHIEKRDGVYYFSGELNEYADLSSLVDDAGPIVINFGGVSRINSIGIRNLMRFVAQTADKKLQYHDCPVALISQINMIPALLGKRSNAKRVHSFFIPFYCESCESDFETRSTYDAAVETLKSGGDIAAPCPQCQRSTSIELEDYFVFMEFGTK